VFGGLEKDDVIDLFPKLLVLAPNVVKSVVQRLSIGETFVLHVLRILTEGGSTRVPTALVNATKILYRRLGDARLLIPVFGGLEKDDVIDLFPKLLVLAPNVVKSVVQRLSIGPSPLTPTELMVALHLVETSPSKENSVSIKRVMEATQYCLDMQQIFRQDVMAVVLSQLSSGTHIPPLYMRTVLHTLSKFPKLNGYVTEILINLISKQVWNDKRLWEGFVKCCQQLAKPSSFAVLLKLPAPQLEDALKIVPDLKEPLAKAARMEKKSLPRASLKILGLDVDKESHDARAEEKENEKHHELVAHVPQVDVQ